MAQKIAVDGTTTEVSPRNGKWFTLAELYEHTECDIVQVITLSDDREMWLHEEGKFFPEKGYNIEATRLASDVLMDGDFIIGPVLVGLSSEFDDNEEDPITKHLKQSPFEDEDPRPRH